MNFKKILTGLLVLPLLVTGGCKKDDDTQVEQLVYTEVSKEETVDYLNQLKEGESFNIPGYKFKTTMYIPEFDFEALSDEEPEFEWPDTTGMTTLKLDGIIMEYQGNLQAKYSMVGMEENVSMYIKDNVVYMNDGTNKFKATFDSALEMEMEGVTTNIPTTDTFLQNIDMICAADSGLKFEKGTLSGKDYYHIYGVPSYEGIEMPIDMTLIIKDNQLVSYKYKVVMFFVLAEFEVEVYDGIIEFPADLYTYIENKDAILED